MSKNCIFCDVPVHKRKIDNEQSRNKEHIFPDWLQKDFDLTRTHLYQTTYDENGDIDTTRKYIFASHLSGFICKGCNQGWMSELEVQARPFLTPLIGGEQTILKQATCEIIAKWLYKTVLTLHTVYMGEKIIPMEH